MLTTAVSCAFVSVPIAVMTVYSYEFVKLPINVMRLARLAFVYEPLKVFSVEIEAVFVVFEVYNEVIFASSVVRLDFRLVISVPYPTRITFDKLLRIEFMLEMLEVCAVEVV